MSSTLIISIYTPLTGGVSLPMTAYQRTYAVQYDIVGNSFVTPALVSITMQRILVTFAVDFVQFILPAAFLLRIIPGTRMLGNMLIAFSIALYVIIPTFYALMGAMDDVVFTNCNQYNLLVADKVFGDCSSANSFWNVARLLPQAFFLPNLMLALIITCISAIYKALRVIT
jgi:hypothetical protein